MPVDATMLSLENPVIHSCISSAQHHDLEVDAPTVDESSTDGAYLTAQQHEVSTCFGTGSSLSVIVIFAVKHPRRELSA